MDGAPDSTDNCPDWPNDQSDFDGNGIGDECECGDQSGELCRLGDLFPEFCLGHPSYGTVDVTDILAISAAIFDPTLATPLCDTNDDGLCDVGDILGSNNKIFGAEAFCSRYPAP